MNRLVATLAVATTLSVAQREQCDKVDLGIENEALKGGNTDADYYLVAMLYAW